MKSVLSIILLLPAFLSVQGQITFKVEDDIYYPDFSVKIGEDVYYPDITIKIGTEVSSADFSLGITSNRAQADFIITESNYADY